MNEQMPPAVTGPVEPTVMQHTRGPWHVSGMVRAAVVIGDDVLRLGNGETAKANARLIAAAPMLLNALLTAEALLYSHGKPIDPAITAALVAAGARAA